jgi:hypothetical protein
MPVDDLRNELAACFPQVEMPPRSELLFHRDCRECADLLEDLDSLRGSKIDGDAIRLLHQELSHLSPAAWRWILPHYLEFCLTPEARYNQMETEFLIYNLGPDLKFQADTAQRLSLLSDNQITCLIHFLEWLLRDEHWNEIYSVHLNKAISFLHVLSADRSKPRS